MTMLTTLDQVAAHLAVPAAPTLALTRTGTLIPTYELAWDATSELVRVTAPLKLDLTSMTPQALAHLVAEVNRTLEVVGIEAAPEPVFVTHAFLDDEGIASETIDRLVQAVDECELRVQQVQAGPT